MQSATHCAWKYWAVPCFRHAAWLPGNRNTEVTADVKKISKNPVRSAGCNTHDEKEWIGNETHADIKRKVE